MTQFDWIGGDKPAKPFRDIRNQRPSTAERKAELCLEIKALALRPPPSVINGSVQLVRKWRAAQEAAMKVCGSARSSIVELELAVKLFDEFKEPTT